jgi:hypothetical protein
MSRKKNAENSIVAFWQMIQSRRYGSVKDITQAASVGATIGSAFKQLGYAKKIAGVYYYTGPDRLPVDKIETKYYEIRARHNTGGKLASAMKSQKEQREISTQGAPEKTYTKVQVIEAFNAFYVREFGKMTEQAYLFSGMLASAL